MASAQSVQGCTVLYIPALCNIVIVASQPVHAIPKDRPKVPHEKALLLILGVRITDKAFPNLPRPVNLRW
jgi:hypothetical protein